MKSFFLLAALFMVTPLCSQNLRKGDVLPAYTFQEGLNVQEDMLSLQKLRGKPVIIEFWATWCRPCLPAMKKMEKYQEKFGDEVHFLTVSSESVRRLEKYIANTQTTLPVIRDTGFRKIIPYRTIPHTVIIDKDGRLAAVTSPWQVTNGVIRDLISGNDIDVQWKEEYVTENSSMKTIAQVKDEAKEIKFTTYDASSTTMTRELYDESGQLAGYDFRNVVLPMIFQRLYDVTTMDRITYGKGLSGNDFEFRQENLYGFSIRVSDRRRLLDQASAFLREKTGLAARWDTRLMSGYILRYSGETMPESGVEPGNINYKGGAYYANGYPVKHLISYLENTLYAPVSDLTGLTGVYDLAIEWEPERPETLFEALEQNGFILQKSDSPMEVEVLELYVASSRQ